MTRCTTHSNSCRLAQPGGDCVCGCGMANHGMGYVQCAEALRTDSGMRRAEQRTLIQDFNKKSEKAERTLRRLLLDWNVKKERRAARMAHAGGRHQRPGARNASGTTSPMRQAAIHILVIDTVPYLTEEDMMRKMLSDICAAYQDTIEDALASLPSRAKMRLADHWMCSVAAAIVKLIDEIQEGEAELKKETSEAMGQLVAKVAEYYLDDRRTHLGHDPGERDITSKKAENRSRFDLDARVLASIQRRRAPAKNADSERGQTSNLAGDEESEYWLRMVEEHEIRIVVSFIRKLAATQTANILDILASPVDARIKTFKKALQIFTCYICVNAERHQMVWEYCMAPLIAEGLSENLEMILTDSLPVFIASPDWQATEITRLRPSS